MTKQNGNDELRLLKSLASNWSAGRGSTVGPLSEVKTTDGFAAKGPGFLYRWDENQNPVRITFLPDGEHQVATEDHAHLLFIGAAEEGISVQTTQRPAHLIKTSHPPQQQQLEEIIDEVRDCIDTQQPGIPDTLTTITAAQRLVALGHTAQFSGLNGRKSAKVPAKNRLATDLHEWLAGELENSVRLGDAAKHFSKSPRQLIRVLKETTGSGFAEHLTMHRLTLARTLLMRTDESIMDVARKSGFNSREQFIRSFNKTIGWTPLQFRKAWNRASLSNSALHELCRISGRDQVEWQSKEQSGRTPTGKENGASHTLVVTNALHEIAELFSIDRTGKRTRAGVLDRGAMIFITRDTEGSIWMIRASDSKLERRFVSPKRHAIAIISPV